MNEIEAAEPWTGHDDNDDDDAYSHNQTENQKWKQNREIHT